MKARKFILAAAATLLCSGLFAQDFNGLDMGLGNLSRISKAETRSICPENFTGEKGKAAMAKPEMPNERNVNNASWAARDLGQGWKVNPYIRIGSKETVTIAEMEGPGAIQHIWMTPTGVWRYSIIRIYWDGEETPSVECPIADFFCMGWNEYAPVVSLPVCVNPGSAFNCYWQMPFRKKCKITMENVNDHEEMTLYYQIDYTLTEVPEDAGYFHAQWRRTRWNESSDYTIVDGIKGQGQFVGCYLAWGLTNNGWWGEGEAKFYIDGDKDFPTISSTGLEDYFCGSYNFDRGGRYIEFCTPYAGLCQVIRPDGTYRSQERFGLYRWHIMDPVRFKKDFKMTIQDLGWRNDGRYLQQHSDIAGTAFWYQTEPHAKFPKFPDWHLLETY
ncbi:MAG: DUF2961 domain-containing protein [Bacteroidales bacterium]|nr:DUF2961 domain-containing protein [Candidatus Equibacterium intestinale]